MARNRTKITPRQQRVIEALLAGKRIKDACEAAGVRRGAYYRWLKDPLFRQALQEAENEAVAEAMRRLLSMQNEAIATLQSILSDANTPPSQKLRAVEVVLGQVLRFRNAVELETRLAALERMVQEASGRDNGDALTCD